MKPMRHLLMGLLATAAAVPAVASTHYAISVQQVASAIRATGVPVEPEQVALLSEVVSTSHSPHLRVSSIERWGSNGVMARLQCESQQECLPFFVRLRMRDGAQQPVVASAAQAVSAPAQNRPAARAVLHVGSPATLMLDGPHVQIRVSVVCLDAGVIGQTIHVTDPDHRQVYTAQVMSDGRLKGRL